MSRSKGHIRVAPEAAAWMRLAKDASEAEFFSRNVLDQLVKEPGLFSPAAHC